jgi:hypothetical protein
MFVSNAELPRAPPWRRNVTPVVSRAAAGGAFETSIEMTGEDSSLRSE